MIYLAIVSLVWAFSYGLIKGELTGIDATLVACLRLGIAVPVFLPLLRLKGLAPKDMAWLAVVGAIQYGLMYNVYIAAFGYLEAYQVATLTVTTPLYVSLLYDAFERRFRPRSLALALLAIVGAVVVVFDIWSWLENFFTANVEPPLLPESPEQPESQIMVWVSIALVQLSNVCFAFGQVAYKRFRAKSPALKDEHVFGLLYLGAVILCLFTTTLNGGWADLGDITARQWCVLAYLGLLASGLCFFWWNKGAVTTNPATLAVFNNVKIPLAVLVSLLVFGESASLPHLLIGGGLIALALWLATRSKATS